MRKAKTFLAAAVIAMAASTLGASSWERFTYEDFAFGATVAETLLGDDGMDVTGIPAIGAAGWIGTGWHPDGSVWQFVDLGASATALDKKEGDDWFVESSIGYGWRSRRDNLWGGFSLVIGMELLDARVWPKNASRLADDSGTLYAGPFARAQVDLRLGAVDLAIGLPVSLMMPVDGGTPTTLVRAQASVLIPVTLEGRHTHIRY